MSYYAVATGQTTGIFTSWADSEAQMKGFSGARYETFNSADEAEAETSRIYDFRPLRASTKNNLKRNYSPQKSHWESSFQYKASDQYVEDSNNSNDGEDLSTVLTKQMDDIEKRLRSFEKGINKILNENTSESSGQAILTEPPQKRNHTIYSHLEFDKDDDGFTIVYTDGARLSKGQQGTRAGYGVYWGDRHPLNTCEQVSGRATKNSSEIQAATHAIKQAIQNGINKLAINTHSQYLINSVTKWMPGWKIRGWKLKSGEPVTNKIDFEELDKLQNQVQIKWNYVQAHRGVYGNKMAGQLAKIGACKNK